MYMYYYLYIYVYIIETQKISQEKVLFFRAYSIIHGRITDLLETVGIDKTCYITTIKN
jgi:hypothetical protein